MAKDSRDLSGTSPEILGAALTVRRGRRKFSLGRLLANRPRVVAVPSRAYASFARLF